ncbi:MAG: 3'(2'),5'-bisphosphate nucleotidase CysQ [Gammaproteobacteria bacterium]|nr:3'(2'),5'-bisphosphate nucleotidase CysQ [Gammaproteobacteria bacterium]MYD79780.1 3'(2'),5'-bisphosphate nucleotidase CysQ [Gammaproteobacteria bacterium]
MIEELVRIAEIAAEEILDIYHSNFEVKSKSDESPVTRADLAAHRAIVQELRQLDPSIPILSEESTLPEFSIRKSWQRYWLIDPLDGTRNFVERNDEFTVNIALIQDGVPVLGVVGVPTLECVYIGDVASRKAMKRASGTMHSIGTRKRRRSRATLVESRHNTTPANEVIADYLVAKQQVSVDRTQMGSSLKICVIAEGQADLYLRMGLTSEWDIAAASAVLLAANGDLRMLGGYPKKYNEQESVLNSSFFACGDDPNYWTRVIADALPNPG